MFALNPWQQEQTLAWQGQALTVACDGYALARQGRAELLDGIRERAIAVRDQAHDDGTRAWAEQELAFLRRNRRAFSSCNR